MTSYTVYHNSRCGNSRGTLLLLQQAGHDPEIINYLETPPSRERLAELVEMMGVHPIEIVRMREATWAEVGGRKDMSADEILDLLAAHPILIQRPIVVKDEQEAMITRPPEMVEDLL